MENIATKAISSIGSPKIAAAAATAVAGQNPLADNVRAANARFKDVAAAVSEGYAPIPCASNSAWEFKCRLHQRAAWGGPFSFESGPVDTYRSHQATDAIVSALMEGLHKAGWVEPRASVSP
jgi:hypothetical protein